MLLPPLRPGLFLAPVFVVSLLASPVTAPAARAAPAKGKGAAPAPAKSPAPPGLPGAKPGELAPLGKNDKPVSSHSPFGDGDCSLCHQGKDPVSPGPVSEKSNEVCFGCHEEYREYLAARPFKHRPAAESCTHCHNPHNSLQPHLLVDDVTDLCLRCHEPLKKLLHASKVKHGAVTAGAKCMTCHTPHASSIENLLVKLPFDLCVECHAQDGMVNGSGRKMTNIKTLLEQNPSWHAPLAAKDCSVCHNPHGSEHFSLLSSQYPAKFYAPYDRANYALCFECHNDQVMSVPETTTLTGFRDGSRNLHYLHVYKAVNGRTCRACHEVHASKWPFHIRESVPYGSKGWLLKIDYARQENGGTCARSCHTSKTYDRSVKAPAKK